MDLHILHVCERKAFLSGVEAIKVRSNSLFLLSGLTSSAVEDMSEISK